MSHGVLLNLIYWQVGKPDFAAGRKTLQFASLSFDVAFQEMFTRGSGGSLVLISEEMQKDLVRLWWLIDEVGVERLFVPFVALQALAEIAEMERRYPKHLREIITAESNSASPGRCAPYFSKYPIVRSKTSMAQQRRTSSRTKLCAAPPRAGLPPAPDRPPHRRRPCLCSG